MTARLSETYQAGDLVEIEFEIGGGDYWRPGRVVGFQHPGVWVQLPGGSLWFVTNTRRIRPARAAGSESE